MIITHQLTSQQQIDVTELTILCKSVDHEFIPIYAHLLRQNRDPGTNILIYKNNQLIGFLSTYFFYEDGCEIAILVHPHYRQKGIAKNMLTTILTKLASDPVQSLYFSSIPANKHWLSQLDLVYQYSEIEMSHNEPDTTCIPQSGVIVRPAMQMDISFLDFMDQACFPHSTNMEQRFKFLLNDKHYLIFILELNHIPVGKLHAHIKPNEIQLSDIAILPNFQRQGLATYLLSYCLNKLNTEKTKTLAVETNNIQALNLYKKLNFKITNQCDYWFISQQKLISTLNLDRI